MKMVMFTCSEAELVLLLTFIVIQRFHPHTWALLLIEGVRASVGVGVDCRLVFI